MVGCITANPGGVAQFENRGFQLRSPRHTDTEIWRYRVVRSKPFIRVCSANLKWPVGDVSTGPDHVSQSVHVPGVPSRTSAGLWRRARLAVSLIPGCA